MTHPYFTNLKYYQIGRDRIKELSIDKNEEFLILCKKSDFRENNRQFLIKILHAINKSIADCHIILIEEYEALDAASLLIQYQPKVLISFEINLNKNGLNIEQKLYKPIHLLNTLIIISESLDKLQ